MGGKSMGGKSMGGQTGWMGKSTRGKSMDKMDKWMDDFMKMDDMSMGKKINGRQIRLGSSPKLQPRIPTIWQIRLVSSPKL